MVAAEIKSEAVRDVRSQQTSHSRDHEELQSCWKNQLQVVVGSSDQ